jgi:hypothetical protein
MTKIGILSDSHGRADTTRAAVAALRARGASLLLHLGDIGSEAVLDELAGLEARIIFGNCDDARQLARHAARLGLADDSPAGRMTVDGSTIAYMHGHLAGPIESALRDEVSFLLHGHTHEVRDERIGPTRIINPGALQRASRYTAALLDPSRDTVQFIVIDASAPCPISPP